MLFKYLNNIKQQEYLVEISREDINEDTIIGYVIDVNDSLIIIQEYSAEALHEGYVIIRLDDITSCSFGGNFLESLEKILDKSIDKNISLNDIETLSDYISIHNDVLFEIYQEDYDNMFKVAELIEIDDEYLILSSYGDLSKIDKKTDIIIGSNITKIAFDTRYSKNIISLQKK